MPKQNVTRMRFAIPGIACACLFGTGHAATWDGAVADKIYAKNGTSLAVNVGIGIITPIYPLHVVGRGFLTNPASTDALTVTQTPGNSSILRLIQGTTTRFNVTWEGKVGIGTDLPGGYNSAANQLVIQNSSGNAGMTISSGTANNGAIYFSDGTSAPIQGFVQYNHSADEMLLGTSTSTRVKINSAGHFGIGTASTSPGSLNGRGRVLEVSAANVGVTNSHPGIVMRSGTSFTSVPAWEMLLSSGQVAGTTDFQLMSGTTGRLMVLGANGNVGVKTTTPAATLDVRGSFGIFDGTLSGDTYQRAVIYSDNANGFLFEGPKNAAGDKYDITFNWRGGGTVPLIMKGTNRFVGIGHTDPHAPLDVAGDAIISGSLTVAGVRTRTWTVAPDYVFEKEYKLASLDEVDSFVKKNKHLPEVPSAKQFKEKGMDLAEMNFLLLKKVEELTLHAIHQNKENQTQGKKIAELEEMLMGMKKK